MLHFDIDIDIDKLIHS